eukprot:TRINITY_DN3976_c0_g1_i3.p1 TRINITY_DN3976_c0_g1~~TRINITY_DN3976_c0_g1_i3.p1  ORF type:complete len:363 (-),score=177.69 TRINITY_DN3976_c0_g1_i3:676-1764(-)
MGNRFATSSINSNLESSSPTNQSKSRAISQQQPPLLSFPQEVWDFLLSNLEEGLKTDSKLIQFIQQLSKNVNIFLNSSAPAIELDDEKHVPVAMKLLEIDPNLPILRKKLVPARIKEAKFWKNYLFHVFLLVRSRSSISKDLGWLQFAKERAVAIEAVIKASRVGQATFGALVNEETAIKKDRSPVTVADYSAQAVINLELTKYFPNDSIVAEEHSADLTQPQGITLKERVIRLASSVQQTNKVDELLPEQEVINAIDRGNFTGGSTGRFWTVDPIDGTLGFLRGEQYAVCVALIENGEVIVGVLGCPNLELQFNENETIKGCLLIAVKGQGATIRPINEPFEKPIYVNDINDPSQVIKFNY